MKQNLYLLYNQFLNIYHHVVPVEYSHTHDGKILFRKYRENFDFGLTVDQYYFNKDAKDKKTNYNTQYTLTQITKFT